MANIHTFRRAGVEMSIDMDKLSPDIIAALVRHGLTQKIGDAAANAAKIAMETKSDVSETAKGLMQKVIDSLLAGDWGVTRGSTGISEETAIARLVTRAAYKDALGAKSEKWAEFTGLSDEEQIARIDALWEKNKEKLADKFAAEQKRREIMRKAKENVKKVSVDLDF